MTADIRGTRSIDAINIPLCVDLDGTLTRSDVLLESIFVIIKQNILYAFMLPLWLLKGKAHIKQQIANRIDLDFSLLPYNEPFLDYLREQKAQGRRLILATASNIKYAEQIALYLGIFDEVLASDADTNLGGLRKRQRLLDAFGERGFDYAGNAQIDLKIWTEARKAILVNPESGVREKAKELVTVERVFEDQKSGLRPYFKALRLQQWLKNILVFIPLVMAHQIHDLKLITQLVLAFLAFGLCASSVYLLNDLLDLPADRQHPTKCNRALAAGIVSIKHATLLIPVLLLTSFTIALWLPTAFLGALALYYVVTLAYSLRLKRVALVDVIVLAGLYTMRLIAGGTAVTVPLSFWLLAFSMFLFFSLALVKRYSELLVLLRKNKQSDQGRGYCVADLETLAKFGAASGLMAVLVLALYINSEKVKSLYSHPEAIWLLCPLLLYWISRIWLMARRNQMHEDPVVFAIGDRHTNWLLLIGLLTLWAAV